MGISREERQKIKQQKAKEKRLKKENKKQAKLKAKQEKQARKEAKKRGVPIDIILHENHITETQNICSTHSIPRNASPMNDHGTIETNSSKNNVSKSRQFSNRLDEHKDTCICLSSSDHNISNQVTEARRIIDKDDKKDLNIDINNAVNDGQFQGNKHGSMKKDSHYDCLVCNEEINLSTCGNQAKESYSPLKRDSSEMISPALIDEETKNHETENNKRNKNDGDGERCKLTRKRWMRSSSVRGAPAQLLPGQQPIVPPVSEGTKIFEEEIVEEEEDKCFGNMECSDAKSTASYLRHIIEKFKEHMHILWDNGTNNGYIHEYRQLATIGSNQECNAAIVEANRLKNRYVNIIPYDHSRVKLKRLGEDTSSDYINASFIPGYKRPNAFIATQGPVPNSFIDFWRMIWEYSINTIVMVTHEVERGRMKCHRYWPDPTSFPPMLVLEYGEITVSHISTIPHKHYVLRAFDITRRGQEVTRRVSQFAFTSWPDHGVPLTTAELLGFRNAINHKSPCNESPIVIHCSAGVGRTGTYIAIENLVRQALDMGGNLSVPSVVANMREYRSHMVQTEIQYIFIYRAVMDCLHELLRDEYRKAETFENAEAEQEALRNAAEIVARETQAEKEREERHIEEARKELLAREETSVSNAKAVVTSSIQDRMNKLMEAEQQWMDNYQRSLQEWNERNQFEAETYDLTSSLTPMESRLEALKQKGMLV